MMETQLTYARMIERRPEAFAPVQVRCAIWV
jgi:hypothetical protein